jgi:sphingolipid delta-4 desaturase
LHRLASHTWEGENDSQVIAQANGLGGNRIVADGAEPIASGRISPQARRHIEIRREILKRHPEAASLTGPDWRGLPGALILLAVHWTALWLVSQTDVLVVFLTAFFFGQICIHSAGALIHETAHRLIFRGDRAKLAFDLLLETITTSFAHQLTYQYKHVSSHHPQLGNYYGDYEHEDVCRQTTRRRFRATRPWLQHLLTVAELLVNLLPLGFMFSDRIFTRFYREGSGRSMKDPERKLAWTRPSVTERRIFIAVSTVTSLFILAVFGPLGLLYQIWSLSLFQSKWGVTNLGQSLSEHPGDDEQVPTRSTYWWGNAILFNTGYHHEHHTFADVPWTRLPALKRLGGDLFDVATDRSYFRFWWDHVTRDFSPTRRNPVQEMDLSERCAAAIAPEGARPV